MSQHLRNTEESDIEAKVAAFNARCRTDSERVTLDRSAAGGLHGGGQLRLHWDVRGQLALVESDGSKPLNGHYAYLGGDQGQEDLTGESGNGEETFGGIRLRHRRNRARQKIPADWRRSVNGHAFRGPCSVLPETGQSMQVLANVNDKVHQVIGNLFTKYKISDPPQSYCIVVLNSDGLEQTLSAQDCPLLVRLSLGPDEDLSGKLLVRESGRPEPRKSIAQLAALPTPLLQQLLESAKREEAEELAVIKASFQWAKSVMESAMLHRRVGGGSTAAGTLRESHL